MMDPTNSKAKRQNISEEESSLVNMISNLPDSLLSHILSFLPTTRECVKTSILSKRWRHVWTFVDRLKFDSTGLRATARSGLPRFVYKALQVHQGNIKEFNLSGACIKHNESDVISWINTAVSRGVEKIHADICFQDDRITNWPLSIFSCKTLVELNMWSLLRESLDIPSTPIFPCLKKLDVMLGNDTFFERVVSRCPALECLAIHVVGTNIDIVSSSMKRLNLDCCTSSPVGRKIVLCVPSLEYLKFFCALPFELIVEEQLSSLIEADIYFCRYPDHSESVNAKQLRDSFVRFIQPFSNVKLLRIKSWCNKFFDSVGHGLFVNLIKLEIESSFFEWRLLLSFMERSINLEAITLSKTAAVYRGFHSMSTKKHKLDWKEPKKVPTSLSSSLRKISIDGYSEEELPMVKYVLTTAQVLEQVDIKCSICYRGKNYLKTDMLQSLQKLHRVSQRCKIVFV